MFEETGHKRYAEIVRGMCKLQSFAMSDHKESIDYNLVYSCSLTDIIPKQTQNGVLYPAISVAAVAVLVTAMGYYNYSSKSSSETRPETSQPPTVVHVPATTATSLLTDAEEELVNNPRSKGPEVVDLCLRKLKSDSFNMLDDNDLMRRIAYVMSGFGENIEDNGGIWQVSHVAFEDTKDTRAHKRLPRKYDQVMTAFGIDWNSVKYKDLDKPFFSALAARLYLSNFPDLIPPAHKIDKQARYWKMYFMRGGGDDRMFVAKVKELEQTHPYTP